MLLIVLVLFIALCPGVLFTAPAFRKMRGKVGIAAIHAVIFVVAVNFLHVTEGFALSVADANAALNSAQAKLESDKFKRATLISSAMSLEPVISLNKSRLTDAQNKLTEMKTARANYDSAQSAFNQAKTVIQSVEYNLLPPFLQKPSYDRYEKSRINMANVKDTFEKTLAANGNIPSLQNAVAAATSALAAEKAKQDKIYAEISSLDTIIKKDEAARTAASNDLSAANAAAANAAAAAGPRPGPRPAPRNPACALPTFFRPPGISC